MAMMESRRRLSDRDRQKFLGKIPLPRGQSLPLQVILIHIPKTAGDTAMMDSVNHLLRGQMLKGNEEITYLGSKAKGHMNGANKLAFVFLRDPKSHILSQFLECKYDHWGRKITKHTGFPGYGRLGDPLEGFDEWVAHFALNPNTYDKTHAFNCYDPWNMQTRYMAALMTRQVDAHFSMDSSGRWPSLETAKSNLQATDVLLGITEHFSASMCLLESRATQGSLTDACKVCDPDSQKLVKVDSKQSIEAHHVPPHSVDMITNKTTLEHIQTLTALDQQLYDYALTLFKEEIQTAMDVTGIDLLCTRGDHGQDNTQTALTTGHNQPNAGMNGGSLLEGVTSTDARGHSALTEETSIAKLAMGLDDLQKRFKAFEAAHVVALGLVLFWIAQRWYDSRSKSKSQSRSRSKRRSPKGGTPRTVNGMVVI